MVAGQPLGATHARRAGWATADSSCSAARAADLLGRRRVLLIGLSVFTGASLLSGLVSDPNLLIAPRFLKGASAAFTAPAGCRSSPRPPNPRRTSYDVGGAVAITSAMPLLVWAVVQAPDSGWGSTTTVAALLATFVAIERRVAHPLLRLGILRNGPLLRANLGAAAVFGSYVGFKFVGTPYVQRLLAWASRDPATWADAA